MSEGVLFSRFLEGFIGVPCNSECVGEKLTVRNYHLASLLSVVSKVFEKLVNNKIVDH